MSETNPAFKRIGDRLAKTRGEDAANSGKPRIDKCEQICVRKNAFPRYHDSTAEAQDGPDPEVSL